MVTTGTLALGAEDVFSGSSPHRRDQTPQCIQVHSIAIAPQAADLPRAAWHAHTEAVLWEWLGASVEHCCRLTSVQPEQRVCWFACPWRVISGLTLCVVQQLCSPVKGTARSVLTNLELQHKDYWWPSGVLPYARCRCTGAHTITGCCTTIIKIHISRADPECGSESCASWCGPLKDPTALWGAAVFQPRQRVGGGEHALGRTSSTGHMVMGSSENKSLQLWWGSGCFVVVSIVKIVHRW